MHIKNHHLPKLKSPLALACAAAFAAGAVSAQDEEFTGLEEVIVTATKRAETLQETGMSITALGDMTLERMGANTLLDFAVRVPNLGMAYEADGRFDSSSPALRGVFGKNTTGFYIDDTPVNASLLPRVIDLERIEVLRGPQGSLYGAKSMGGTIRMITKQPKLNESESTLHASGSSVKEGDWNSSFDASFNLPVVEDKIALRVAAYFGQNSGIFDREYISSWVEAGSGATRQNTGPAFETNENVDDESYWGGQIAAKIVMSENLTFTPKLMAQQVDADGLPFADNNAGDTTTPRFFDSEEPGTDEWWLASGTFDWELDAGTIVSTTSWYNRTTDETEEEHSFLHWLFNVDIGIPIDPLESVLSTVEKYEAFVHETRFTSSSDGPFQYTAGFFYSDSQWDHHYPRAVQTGLAAALDDFVGEPGFGQNCEYGFCLTNDDLIFTNTTITDTRETAAFGELTYEFNDRFSITAGGRFYKTEIDAVNSADGFANSGPTSYVADFSESGFNPKVMAKMDVNDDINLYASASKGFRPGGVNGNLPLGLCGDELASIGVDPAEQVTYDSDTLWSYELGLKSTLADNRVTFNAAVYQIQWSDVRQLNRLGCGFQYSYNAGEAESTGFELELTAAPVEGLTLSAALGYTDAEITDDGDAIGVAVGDKIQGVPDVTFSGSAEYVFPLFAGWDGVVRADANHYGDSYSSNNEGVGANARLREAWSTLNLRAGMFNDSWEFTLFADNVTDERVNLADSRSIAAETPGRQRLVVNRPRTIGIEARYRF